MEGIFWFWYPSFLFLNCGFCVSHRKLFSITSSKKEDFCLRGAQWSPAAFSVFECLAVRSFHDIYSQTHRVPHNILDWIFFLLLGFCWQSVVKTGPWSCKCIIQVFGIILNYWDIIESGLYSRNGYFRWDLHCEAKVFFHQFYIPDLKSRVVLVDGGTGVPRGLQEEEWGKKVTMTMPTTGTETAEKWFGSGPAPFSRPVWSRSSC